MTAPAFTDSSVPPGHDRLEWKKQFNHDVSSLRSGIDHVIGRVKK